jgi:glycosyltransferase involved in cell wall biosynthesis
MPMSAPPRPRLRILRVIARLNVGGPAQHVALLTERLDPDRFETFLATGEPGPGEGDMLDLRPALGARIKDRIVSVPGLGRDPRPGSDARALRSLLRLTGELRPHIVHTHTAKAGTLGRLAARAKHVPVVVHTFHGTVFAGHFRPMLGRAIATWERVLGHVSDAVIAVSPAVAGDLARHHIASGRVRVVPLGLDLEPFASVPPISGAPSPALTLVARLAPVKDIPLFIEAAQLVRERLPGLVVRIAGDGPLRRSLEESSPEWVSFLGHQGDLPALLATTGVVALSSRSEGSPVALIEALAAARPVAAVAVGGVRDLLSGRPGAVLAGERSAAALASVITQALGDPAVAAAAAEGRGGLLEDFGIDRLVRDIEALYEELWDAYARRQEKEG